MDPYQVLQVSPLASAEEIRAAYRRLARRWHPDRFAEGPERDWANEKMASINTAYNRCRRGESFKITAGHANEESELAQISRMVTNGYLSEARGRLMKLHGRSAEWNYLLGMILLKTNDINKAKIYLSIAAHQRPGVARYAEALKTAEEGKPSIMNSLLKRFSR